MTGWASLITLFDISMLSYFFLDSHEKPWPRFWNIFSSTILIKLCSSSFWERFQIDHFTLSDDMRWNWGRILKSKFNPSPRVFSNLNIVLISNVFAILPAFLLSLLLFQITEPNYSNEHNTNEWMKERKIK